MNAPARVGESGGRCSPASASTSFPRWRAGRSRASRTTPRCGSISSAGTRRDPLLATWQYELGRVAVVPLDFQSGAAEWAGWEGFGTLWSQLVLWTLPPPAEAATRPLDDEAVGRELRTVGPNLPLLRQLAAATGGALDPAPDALLAARPGVEHEAVPLAPFLVPLVILAVLGDIAFRQLGR